MCGRYFRGLSKLALAGGAIYVTLDQGVWKTTTEGSKALNRVRKDVLPTADEYFTNKVVDKCSLQPVLSELPYCMWYDCMPAIHIIFQVPSTEDVSNTVVEGWNSGKFRYKKTHLHYEQLL